MKPDTSVLKPTGLLLCAVKNCVSIHPAVDDNHNRNIFQGRGLVPHANAFESSSRRKKHH